MAKRKYDCPAWDDLGWLATPWAGWKLRDDELISPEGWRVPMPWVHALPLTREVLHAHRGRTTLIHSIGFSSLRSPET